VTRRASEAAGEDTAQRQADLAGALHEVSNALTVVLGWLDVARAKLAAQAQPDAVEEALDVAQMHARLGHRVAREAIGADATYAGSSQRAARTLAHTAVQGVTPHAESRRIQLLVEEHRGCTALVRDTGPVLQILTNLLLNAIEMSPLGSKVVIAVSGTGSHASYVVSDNGPGIEAERVEGLFLGGDSTRPGGTGIGLRHSLAVARTHGGDLLLIEREPHARFQLLWPIGAGSAPRRPAPAAQSLEGVRVLVLEDDQAVCTLIELALSARGARATTLHSLEQLDAALARGEPFDAALVDLSPIADDVEGGMRRLRGASPEARIIVISGVLDGVSEQVSQEISAWVRKPFEMGEVIETLGYLLSQRATFPSLA
jgi:CheY-like chemotaxis protein/two-component sensor histidine kinase